MAATVPLGVIGGALCGLAGYGVGLALERRNDNGKRTKDGQTGPPPPTME